MTDRYESPLASRYASDYMLNLFSSDTRYQTWRKLWVALAREESRLGLPITQEQVAELEAHISEPRCTGCSVSGLCSGQAPPCSDGSIPSS